MIVHSPDSKKKKLSHIAFIMDGNGRWAKARGMIREKGHIEGAKTFQNVVEYCFNGGIDTVTVYAFSTENWKRPKAEVDAIMVLLENYIKRGIRSIAEKNDVRVRIIGDKSPLSPKILKLIDQLEEESKNNTHTLNVAVNYGGRAEIVTAVNRLIASGVTEVTEEMIGDAIYTGGQNDPDLIVRTAGELRLSNFLTWQSVYSEFYFTDTLWPDMGEKDIDSAVDAYYGRTRRFGAV